MRIKEKMIILPALYIIKRDSIVSTSELIVELTNVFNPAGEDAAILEGRNDTKFSQIVRNLKSHRDNNSMDIYTNLTADGKYTITKAGEKYLEDNLEQIEYLFSNNFEYEDVAGLINAIESVQEKDKDKNKRLYVYSEDDMNSIDVKVSEGKGSKRERTVRERSKKLRDKAIEHYRKSDGKIYCTVCDFNFEDRYGELGKDYIEMHHEKPIYQYSDDGFESYMKEAVLNLKPLCANCHRIIHRNSKKTLSIDELKQYILK